MELSVGLMLILLGILNLSGMMRWIARNFAGVTVILIPMGNLVLPTALAAENGGDESAPSLGWMIARSAGWGFTNCSAR